MAEGQVLKDKDSRENQVRLYSTMDSSQIAQNNKLKSSYIPTCQQQGQSLDAHALKDSANWFSLELGELASYTVISLKEGTIFTQGPEMKSYTNKARLSLWYGDS